VGNGIGQRSRAFRITGNIIVPAVGAYVPDGLMDVTDYGRGIVFGIDGGGIVVSTGSTVKRYTPANSSLGADAVYSLLNDRGRQPVGGHLQGWREHVVARAQLVQNA
jgi:cysteine synthase